MSDESGPTEAVTSAATADVEPKLVHFPVAFFAMVMGLAGLAIAVGKMEAGLAFHLGASAVLAIIAALAFAVLIVFYAAKAVRHWPAARAEFEHPVKLHFFPTLSISVLLLSILAVEHQLPVATGIFFVGAGLQLALTLAVLHYWFNRQHFQTVHLNPAWFIPIVGNCIVPISGAQLGFVESSWFFFSIGIVYWMVLMAIITNRVLFHNPLPERLAPTLFILVAPPAVAFLGYVRLTGTIDGFARVLYYFSLFMTLFLALQVPRLMRMRFFLSWWAYSFPLAAIAIASWTMYERTGNWGFLPIASALTIVLVVAVGLLAMRTGLAVARDEICQPD